MGSPKQRLSTLLVALLLLISLRGGVEAQTQADDTRTDSVKTGAIRGRVVNESGQPLAYAAVQVRAFNSSGPVRSTRTDAEGNFQLNGLDLLAYTVSATAPAYTTAPHDPDNPQLTYYRVGDSVRLELIKGGVITGTVTTSTGEPVLAVGVRAYLIRDGNGQPPRYGMPFTERTTDDRGIYRIYGLATGTYLVSAGGAGHFSGFNVNAHDADAPTYAPSGTRDTANEITVRAGEEAAQVDIRYLGEPGHVVSGMASGLGGTATPYGFTIRLSSISNGISHWNQSSFQRLGNRGFAFYGIADGDYHLTADAFSPGGDWVVSEPRRIKVKGADLAGIELTTRPLGMVSGRVALEESKALECKGKRRPLFAEMLVTAWHNARDVPKDQPQFLWSLGAPAAPDKQGEFALRNLAPGEYRFETRFFAKYWYLHAISLRPFVAPAEKTLSASRSADTSRNWTTIKTGDRVSGLTITLAEGAASFRGKVQSVTNEKIPPKFYVHLIPAEKEKADNLLRFFAVVVSHDGTFSFTNLSPGRYWILARAAEDNELPVIPRLRVPDETEMRAKLRREAEAGKSEIEFKPCQNVLDYQLPMKSGAPRSVSSGATPQ